MVAFMAMRIRRRRSRLFPGVNDSGRGFFSITTKIDLEKGPTPVSARVSPTDRLHAEIDQVFATGGAVVVALVTAHDAYGAKSDGGVTPDGRLVVRRRIDHRPVVLSIFHQVAGQRAHGVAADPTLGGRRGPGRCRSTRAGRRARPPRRTAPCRAPAHRAGRRTGWRTGRRRATPRTRPRQPSAARPPAYAGSAATRARARP